MYTDITSIVIAPATTFVSSAAHVVSIVLRTRFEIVLIVIIVFLVFVLVEDFVFVSVFIFVLFALKNGDSSKSARGTWAALVCTYIVVVANVVQFQLFVFPLLSRFGWNR